MSTHNVKASQALQAIAAELAFLSPESASSMGAVVSALDILMQSPAVQARPQVSALVWQERDWAQQVQAGTVKLLGSDLERLQASYFQIEELLAAPVSTPAQLPTLKTAPAATAEQEEEPALFIGPADDVEFLNEFCNEGRELLAQIEQGVLVLEEESDQKEMLNQVFRAFHTFKGGAGLLNLTPVKHLAHEMESLLSAARNGQLPINRRVIELILAGADAMRSYVDLIGQRLQGVDTDHPVQIPTQALIAKVKACLHGEEEPTSSEAPVAAPTVPLFPVPTPAVKAADASLSLHATTPAPVENLVNFVKLDSRKLDLLIELVGELVIAQSLVVEEQNVRALLSSGSASQLRQLARVTADLQQSAMSMRMVPIRGIFQKMSRLVRDLSVSQNKQVRLQLIGEETEIDRNMVEELADPLMHMIRNAIDHGMEPPQTRVDNGKPAEGTIQLRAFHRDGGIVISISDDGRGMDPNRIRSKAIEKQLIAAHDVLTPAEIFELIFQPGFSTAETLTEVSGRGVGMDVVRGHIAHLRGRVEVQSNLGQGSEFRILLPLTLAIIDGMVVRVSDERFIFPLLSIRQSLKPQAGMISTVQGRGELINVRGKLIPLVRLNEQLEIPSDITEPMDGMVVVVESRSQLRGILVDELIGNRELVIKPLGGIFKNALGTPSCAILGDGRVALILDPDTLGTLGKTGPSTKPHARSAVSSTSVMD